MKLQNVTLKFEVTNCDLKLYETTNCDCIHIHTKYEPLKNDKNIHIKGLKNDNFWYGKVSKWSINGS